MRGEFIQASLAVQRFERHEEGNLERVSLYFPGDQGIQRAETRSLQPLSTSV